MLRFEYPEYLWLLLSIPALVLVFYIARIYSFRVLRKFGDPGLVSRLSPETSNVKPWVKFTLLMLALATMLIGIADLQVGTKLAEATRKGGDIIIALDVSNSMLAKDSPSESSPTRLDLAKFAVNKLVDNLKGDQVGFVIFAGEAAVHMPLTSDYSAAKLFLSTVSPDLIPVQGTAIAAALETAMTSFNYSYPGEGEENEDNNQTNEEEEQKDKILILITDGENHEEDAVENAAKAAEKGLNIYTIGMGSPNGSPIPEFRNGIKTGDYMRDKEGKIVLTKLNQDILKEIADIGNGRYIAADDGDPDLAGLLDDIKNADKKELEKRTFSEYEDRFQYFLAFTFLFMVMEFFIKNKKNKLIARYNLFGDNQK